MKRLRALLRRLLRRPTQPAPCAHERVTLDLYGGYVMRWRCLDCPHTEIAGWIFVGVSNRRRQPWEHGEA